MAFAVTNDFTNGTLADADEVNANFTDIENVLNGNADSYAQVPSIVPIGSVVAWLKTFAEADSGTTDSTSADHLIQSGQNFETTIKVGMIVHNTTDDTFANVTAVNSDTDLTIDSDIIISGENYVIYKTPKLPDGWVECDGTAISDADSPYNGVNSPDLNGDSNTQRFLRGATSSGGLGGTENHTHTVNYNATISAGSGSPRNLFENSVVSTSTGTLPTYYEVVWIMRVK